MCSNIYGAHYSCDVTVEDNDVIVNGDGVTMHGVGVTMNCVGVTMSVGLTMYGNSIIISLPCGNSFTMHVDSCTVQGESVAVHGDREIVHAENLTVYGESVTAITSPWTSKTFIYFLMFTGNLKFIIE